jgi:ABC-2 type transport system permease protein
VNLSALRAAARLGFRHHLAYRAEIVIQLVAACIIAALNGALWTAAGESSATLAGVPTPAIRAGVLVAWAGIGAVATRVHEDMGERFRTGQIAADLVRPISLPAMVYARDLGRASAAFLVQAVPLLGISATFAPLGLPHAPERWLAWVLSLFGAHLVNVGLSFSLGIGAFRIGSATGLTHLKATMVSLFAGALLPLELFGPTLRAVAQCLPFHLLGRTPAQVLVGNAPVLPLLAEQAAWAAGLWMLGVVLWRRAARSFTLQGG